LRPDAQLLAVMLSFSAAHAEPPQQFSHDEARFSA
jgi:hypothetical protein